MRIQKVCFKNLNSLVGEWEIDLTHPSFVSDGIFAITGPTGAGKSTILDAICLALYGRTPRLSKVTKSGNEIMSRQTGECYSEVTFETQSGRYRCHWSQHRARKKLNGELQAPKHEIADADSGKIFEAKIRGVAEQIESATGMDFDRFTRSMLLAQGDFAAFLQANPDERAPILEQITGTEIYSQISIRVHERRSEESKRLDTLLAELAGMQLLSEDDEKQLNISLEQKTQGDSEISRQILLTSQAIAWLDGIVRLQQELKIVEGQKQDWQLRHEASAPDQEKLQRATQALELAGDHTGLTSIRREQESDRLNHGECLKVLPVREEAAKHAEEAMKLAREQLDKKKVEQKEGLIVIRKTRDLDLKLHEKDVPIKIASETVSDLEKTFGTLSTKHNEDVTNLSVKKKNLEEILQSLAETHADEALIEQLTGIRGQFDSLKNLQKQLNAKIAEVKTGESQATQSSRLWTGQAEKFEVLKRGLENSLKVFTQKQLDLKNSLENRGLPQWRESVSVLTEKKSILDKIIEAIQSLANSRQSLAEFGKRHGALDAEKSNLSGQLQIQGERQTSLEREMILLETQLSLVKKIQDFEEARHQLQDDEPCPLCGAKEHPFAKGNLPIPDETTSALSKVRADLKAASDTVAKLKVRQAEVNKDLEQLTAKEKECNEEITASESLVNQSCADLAIDGADQDLSGRLKDLQKENADKLNQATGTVQAAEAMEKEIEQLRDSLEKIKESVVLADRETQTAAHKKDSAGQELERLKKEVEVLDEQQKQLLTGLRQDLSVYGVKTLSIDSLDQVQTDLTLRRNLWVARQKEKSDLEQQITALEIQTRHQTEQIQKIDSELKKQQDLLRVLQRERDGLSDERRELFGDKNPDDEETRFTTAIETAEKKLDDTRQVLNEANQELGKLKNRIEELDKSMAARVIQLKTVEDAFLTRLGALGFADEANYVAACLPENERKDLMQQAQKLANEQTELASKERDKTTQLEIERQKKVTEQPREELNLVYSTV